MPRWRSRAAEPDHLGTGNRDGYNFGGGGVRVTERQDADKVDLQVHIPNSWGVHFSSRRGVRIEVQVPSDTVLDLHSATAIFAWTARLDRRGSIPATAASR